MRQIYKVHLRQRHMGSAAGGGGGEGEEDNVETVLPRLFTGMANDTNNQGELFGMENLLSYSDTGMMAAITGDPNELVVRNSDELMPNAEQQLLEQIEDDGMNDILGSRSMVKQNAFMTKKKGTGSTQEESLDDDDDDESQSQMMIDNNTKGMKLRARKSRSSETEESELLTLAQQTPNTNTESSVSFSHPYSQSQGGFGMESSETQMNTETEREMGMNDGDDLEDTQDIIGNGRGRGGKKVHSSNSSNNNNNINSSNNNSNNNSNNEMMPPPPREGSSQSQQPSSTTTVYDSQGGASQASSSLGAPIPFVSGAAAIEEKSNANAISKSKKDNLADVSKGTINLFGNAVKLDSGEEQSAIPKPDYGRKKKKKKKKKKNSKS